MPSTTVDATKVCLDACQPLHLHNGTVHAEPTSVFFWGWGMRAAGKPCLPGGVVKGPKGAGFVKEEACVSLLLLLQQGIANIMA